MIEQLILGSPFSEDFIKAEKKRLPANECLDSFALKLILNDYPGAAQAFLVLKKQKMLASTFDFKLLSAFYYCTTQNFEAAQQVLDSLKTSNLETENFLVSFLRLTLSFSQERYSEVLSLLNTLKPSAFTSLKRIYCLLCIKDNNSALDTIKLDKENFPESRFYYSMYSKLLKQKYPEALSLLSTQDSELPFQDSLLLKSFLLIRLEHYPESLLILNNLLSTNNKNEPAWHLLSISLYKLGLLSDCFWAVSKCLKFNPESTLYLFNLSQLYTKKQMFQIANGILLKVKKIKPDFEPDEEFLFPVIDFSEFGKRKKQFVPIGVCVKEKIFVKPIPKKKLGKKKKIGKKDVKEGMKGEFELAETLENMSKERKIRVGKKKARKGAFQPRD